MKVKSAMKDKTSEFELLKHFVKRKIQKLILMIFMLMGMLSVWYYYNVLEITSIFYHLFAL